MIVRVDLTTVPAVVTLEEPDDCRRFHIAVVGGTDRTQAGEALAATGTGRLTDGDQAGGPVAAVRVAAVRELAAGRVGPGWEDDFAAMLDYARSKGWLDAAGEAIIAHLEFTPP